MIIYIISIIIFHSTGIQNSLHNELEKNLKFKVYNRAYNMIRVNINT